MREINGNFDSCNSCKRLAPSRLHELHESKFPFVLRIEFIRSKLSNFSAHVYGAGVNTVLIRDRAAILGNRPPRGRYPVDDQSRWLNHSRIATEFSDRPGGNMESSQKFAFFFLELGIYWENNAKIKVAQKHL